MDELLKKLLEAEILNEETKTELEQAFKQQLEEAVKAAREETSADVRAELTEQWVKERDAVIDAVDTKVGAFLETELSELKEDIERFRDLEAEKAEEVVKVKEGMANELKKDLADLVEKIDAFLEMRLNAEFEELREDIDEQRKNLFGRKIFEAFAEEFLANHADEESAAATLRETQQQLNDTAHALEKAEQKIAEHERTTTMAKVLSPLTGRAKDIMEAILRNVDTDNLEEGYKTFIGRVLRESADNEKTKTSEKEEAVLAEGKRSKKTAKQPKKTVEKVVEENVTKNGDTELTEAEKRELTGKQTLSESARERLYRLGGIH